MCQTLNVVTLCECLHAEAALCSEPTAHVLSVAVIVRCSLMKHVITINNIVTPCTLL